MIIRGNSGPPHRTVVLARPPPSGSLRSPVRFPVSGRNVVINQPGLPGQPGSQITVPLQTLQTLQPGQGIPTGQAGHLLVKTDNGQYQILRVGSTSASAPSSSTPNANPVVTSIAGVPAGLASNNVISGHPSSASNHLSSPHLSSGTSVVNSGSLSSSVTSGHSGHSGTNATSGSLMSSGTSGSSSNSSSNSHSSLLVSHPSSNHHPHHHPHHHPGGTTAPPSAGAAASSTASSASSSAASSSSSSSSGMTGQMTPDTAKLKCKNFLATLLRLASEQPESVARNVRNLIQGLIDGHVDPEVFTTRLQRELNSSPQPCLVPFLKRSLPYLQRSLFTNELTIEGVRAPPRSVLAVAASPQTLVTPPQLRMNRPQLTVAPPTIVQSTRGRPPLNPNRVTPSSLVTLNRPQVPRVPQHQHHQLIQQQSNKMLSTYSTPAPRPVIMPPVPTTMPTPVALAAPTPVVVSAASANLPPPPPVAAPPLTAANLSAIPPAPIPAPPLPPTPVSTPAAAVPPLTVASSSSSTASSSLKEKKSSNTYSVAGDEDINDVAAMGGVNLQEESQRMQGPTDLIGTQIRSCKDDDETFLQTGLLHSKVGKLCRERGLEEPSPEVIACISHATEERLKTLIEKLSVIAEHRMDVIKLQEDYEVTQDVKSQLSFLGDLDKLERRRHDEAERELLLRAARSRTKTEDPEKEKLKAKAKELQRFEEERLRHDKANDTALLASGGPRSKKFKLDNNLIGGLGTSRAAAMPIRPRIKRVHQRDLMFLMEQEKELKRSSILWKAYCS